MFRRHLDADRPHGGQPRNPDVFLIPVMIAAATATIIIATGSLLYSLLGMVAVALVCGLVQRVVREHAVQTLSVESHHEPPGDAAGRRTGRPTDAVFSELFPLTTTSDTRSARGRGRSGLERPAAISLSVPPTEWPFTTTPRESELPEGGMLITGQAPPNTRAPLDLDGAAGTVALVGGGLVLGGIVLPFLAYGFVVVVGWMLVVGLTGRLPVPSDSSSNYSATSPPSAVYGSYTSPVPEVVEIAVETPTGPRYLQIVGAQEVVVVSVRSRDEIPSYDQTRAIGVSAAASLWKGPPVYIIEARDARVAVGPVKAGNVRNLVAQVTHDNRFALWASHSGLVNGPPVATYGIVGASTSVETGFSLQSELGHGYSAVSAEPAAQLHATLAARHAAAPLSAESLQAFVDAHVERVVIYVIGNVATLARGAVAETATDRLVIRTGIDADVRSWHDRHGSGFTSSRSRTAPTLPERSSYKPPIRSGR